MHVLYWYEYVLFIPYLIGELYCDTWNMRPTKEPTKSNQSTETIKCSSVGQVFDSPIFVQIIGMVGEPSATQHTDLTKEGACLIRLSKEHMAKDDTTSLNWAQKCSFIFRHQHVWWRYIYYNHEIMASHSH